MPLTLTERMSSPRQPETSSAHCYWKREEEWESLEEEEQGKYLVDGVVVDEGLHDVMFVNPTCPLAASSKTSKKRSPNVLPSDMPLSSSRYHRE
jgi:hypothetical protein